MYCSSNPTYLPISENKGRVLSLKLVAHIQDAWESFSVYIKAGQNWSIIENHRTSLAGLPAEPFAVRESFR